MLNPAANNARQAQWNPAAVQKSMPVKGVDRKQPDADQEDAEALRAQKDSITNQLVQLRSMSDSPASQESIKALEDRLGEVNDKLAAGGVASPTASAFARLEGKTDEYAPSQPDGAPVSAPEDEKTPENEKPSEETLTTNTDKVDREISQLKKAVSGLEEQYKSALRGDPDSAKDIRRRLNLARAELEQKNNDSYRKNHANYFTGE